MTKTQAFDEACSSLKTAQQTFEREQARAATISAEIERSSAEIVAADPDGDPKVFARLVSARDAARGRLEAVAVRETRAREAVATAEQLVLKAKLDLREAEIAEVDAQITSKSAKLDERVAAFKAGLANQVAALKGERDAAVVELRALIDRANQAEAEIDGRFRERLERDPAGELRGCSWARVAPGANLWGDRGVDAVIEHPEGAPEILPYQALVANTRGMMDA